MQIRSLKTNPGFPLPPDAVFRGCWEYELGTGEVTSPHVHLHEEEINLVLDGRGLITVGGQTHEVGAGEIVLVPPQTAHRMENPFQPPFRGLTIEATLPGSLDAATRPSEAKVTLGDLETVISSIPDDVDAAQALQIIIRLFDLAGNLSEQIEHAIGLDTQTGLGTLATIEERVMNAVVRISRSYSGESPPSQHRRRF